MNAPHDNNEFRDQAGRNQRAMTVAKHKVPGQDLEKGGGSGGKRRGKRLDDDTDED